ncbi:hypothetical protein HZA56_13975 [Candidatus Poribacteria bacterium]|nr:hypothetical protein [Candidatus Poribacteria bacterium]
MSSPEEQKQYSAGRPKGAASKRTIERMTAKRRLVERVVANTDRLFNAQLDKAIGEKYLMVKITERGARGAIKREYHEIVTDPEDIIRFLDGEMENTDTEYYYMTTKPADNMAISNLLDRAYGKPTEKVELGGKEEGDLSDLSDEEIQERLNVRIDAYLAARQRSRD